METGDTNAYADRTVAAFADVPVPKPLVTLSCGAGSASVSAVLG